MAALVVLLCHCFLLYPVAWTTHHSPLDGGARDIFSWITRTPLGLPVNGHASVIVFFALSGLVLTFPLSKKGRLTEYYIKRVLRIWPPFAVAVLLSAALQWAIDPQMGHSFSAWTRIAWTEKLTWKLLAQHLVLINGTHHELDNPMWSLVHEMRVSLVFPLIVPAVKRAPIASLIGALILLLVGDFAPAHAGTLVDQAAQTATYVFVFVLGAMLGTHIGAVRGWIGRMPGSMRASAWAAAVCLLALTPIANSVRGSIGAAAALAGAGFGAAMVVGLCLNENVVTRVLETAFPAWVGRISYSLYLVHLPIIAAIGYGFPGMSTALLIALAIPLSLAAAEILNRLVETPSENGGRWLAGHARRSLERARTGRAASGMVAENGQG